MFVSQKEIYSQKKVFFHLKTCCFLLGWWAELLVSKLIALWNLKQGLTGLFDDFLVTIWTIFLTLFNSFLTIFLMILLLFVSKYFLARFCWNRDTCFYLQNDNIFSHCAFAALAVKLLLFCSELNAILRLALLTRTAWREESGQTQCPFLDISQHSIG